MSVKNLSLWQKLVILAAVPLLTLIALSFMTLNNEYKDYKLLLDTKLNSDLTTATSELIHALQMERGKSSLFVGGAVAAAAVEAQRKVTTEKKMTFSKALKNARIDGKYSLDAVKSMKNGEGIAVRVREAQKVNLNVAEKLGTVFEEINKASTRESEEVGRISTAIIEINKVVQQSASHSEQTAAAGEELLSQAETLQEGPVPQLMRLINGGTTYTYLKAA